MGPVTGSPALLGLSLYLLCMYLPSVPDALGEVWRRGPHDVLDAFRGRVHRFRPFLCRQGGPLPSYVFERFCPDDIGRGEAYGYAGDTSGTHHREPHVDTARTDLFFVLALSGLLAVLRVGVVWAVVPRYLAPQRLAAMVREKSSHMLSSRSYAFDGAGRGRSLSDLGAPAASARNLEIREPSPAPRAVSPKHEDPDDSFEDLGGGYWINIGGLDENKGSGGDRDRDHGSRRRSRTPPPPVRRQFGNEAPPRKNTSAGDVYIAPARKPSSGIRRRVSRSPSTVLQSVRRLVREGGDANDVIRIWYKLRSAVHRSLGHDFGHFPADSRRAAPDAAETLRLFSAPRQATALFRLAFCASSAASALRMFRSADFWPVLLGGRGRTVNCWNLSGGISGALDSDYDHLNSALRYFFLCQAAYHLHSLCFQAFSTLLMLLYGGADRLVSMRTGLRGYVRPLIEHLLGVVIITLIFIFAGTRRLGTLGMFAFDASSVGLYSLQVCINAPQGSFSRRPKVVKAVHQVAVLSFVYCRFVIFPFVVWRSAALESRDWLGQIEKAFFPGAAALLFRTFNALLSAHFASNVVFFWRLVWHPQVASIMEGGEDMLRKTE